MDFGIVITKIGSINNGYYDSSFDDIDSTGPMWLQRVKIFKFKFKNFLY